MLGWLSRFREGWKAASFRRDIKAKYDAAQTTTDNARYWSNADSLGPRTQTSSHIRTILRDRCRYEVENNSTAKGMVLTSSNDVVGTGPRLQLLSDDADMNRLVEMQFSRWSQAVDLAGKMRLMRSQKVVEGETFAVRFINSELSAQVPLDFRIVGAEQVDGSEFGTAVGFDGLDGSIDYDEIGNPVTYWIYPQSPNDGYTTTPRPFPASVVSHLYRVDRPGQLRGVPEITSALPLFSDARRYRDAVISAAQMAGYLSGVLFTDAPPDAEACEVDPDIVIELEKRSLITVPSGWKMGQVKAEQPTTTYVDFMRAIVNEMARCLQMPYNVAALDSSDYNYASGRLDHQTYFKAISVEQSVFQTRFLDPTFDTWKALAAQAGVIPAELDLAMIPHTWFWDRLQHVDPLKEANAAIALRDAGLVTDAELFAERKQDWETQYAQMARELQAKRDLGLIVEVATPEPVEVEDDDE